MDSSGLDPALLNRWQHLHLLSRSNTCTPSQRADNLRCLLAQVEHSRASNRLSVDASAGMFLSIADKYAGLIDSPEEQAGMNNFAEGALSLLVGKRNESKLWSSSLTKDKIDQLHCVDKFVEDSKAAIGVIVPPGREDSLLCLEPASEQASHFTASNHGNSNHGNSNPGNQGSQTLAARNVHPNTAKPVNSFPSAAKQTPLFRPTTVGQGFPQDGDTGPSRGPLYRDGDSEGSLWHGGSGAGSSHGRAMHSFGTRGRGNQNNFVRSEPTKRPFAEHDEAGEDQEKDAVGPGCFRTAREQLAIDSQKKFGGNQVNTSAYGTNKRSLGTRRGPSSRFVPPIMSRDESDEGSTVARKIGGPATKSNSTEEVTDERLKNIEPKMVELIMSEIMDHGPSVSWDDIAGLQFAKKTIQEIVVWPMLRPDIFTGLRGPPKGLLLFGPPGTGKTLIGKCIASQSKSTFFSISASSLTSKWVGEGEKMVRALFAVARVYQPAVIFIDEIDSLLSQRSDGEHEASRRIKTEFLVQLDGAGTGEEDRILVVGATNRPQEIDEAARRRFVKRLYIPLPEGAARRQIVSHLMSQQKHDISQTDLDFICSGSEGYSGADMANLCREAALGPIRSISFSDIESITPEQVRPIVLTDFESALKQVRASVSSKDLDVYLDWNQMYGSWSL